MSIGLKAERYLRNLLVRTIPPEHFVKIYSFMRNWGMRRLARTLREPVRVCEYEVDVCGIRFRNDLGNAAGFDKDGELLEFNYLMGAGFGLVGTVLNKPHKGNLINTYGAKSNPWTPLPYTNGAVNSLGLPSKGIGVVLDNIRKFQDKYPDAKNGFPIILSIMGHPEQEGDEKLGGVLECVEHAAPYVEAFELNESCPNVAHRDDGLENRVESVVKVVRRSSYRYLPLFVKLGDIGDAAHTIKFLTELGIDGITVINTQKDYGNLEKDIDNRDRELFKFYTETHKGGVSGAPVRERAFENVMTLDRERKSQKSNIKIVHVGGIETRHDVVRSRDYADLRQWYTGFMTRMKNTPLSRIYKNMVSE
jgi:dihydroorotate dehydrogenase